MSIIGKIGGALEHAVTSTVKGIGDDVAGIVKGAGKALGGVGELAKGALTLNPKEMGKGALDVGKGAFTTVTSGMSLTPEALAGSAGLNLLKGGVDELKGNDGNSENG
ncbi:MULTISPECIES: hypothetical protein [Paraburkholderia]|uniref:Uncharacterized protein n=1 Tax=Paraburkholderia megapolitana TaxID=420953 RepID=A0A1I3DVR6_9BURK|nr:MULTISPECIES: hypothetical protein [Paraburkholderia]MCX4161394.1 hypothetical protein [Paraburkholderia megapolitana]MDN7156890.1 hypothetical protein [Paraburkholderia sp. CHISQ3]MDQ6493935.1 hypothetical protein [Paraburkholderia megapolitana]QDQ79791.1 hypothetical protein FNZ07_00625 [Paraburkholderia megapolitana]SFH90820.1 hypothetical protein SAMN05192543_101549 [Paraburkholderia megapolitana]